MNLQKIINNKEKYEKEFNIWKNVNSILNEETNFEKQDLFWIITVFFLSFALSFCLTFFTTGFDFEIFFLLGLFAMVPVSILFNKFEYFLRKIKYKNNIEKNNRYLKLFSVSKTVLIPSLENKRIKNIKKETDIIGFDNYLNFKNIIENNNYRTNYGFTGFVISIIEKSKNQEILKIKENELVNFLEKFSLEEQELITNKIKEKISKKDLITDNINSNLKEIKKISVNNNIIKEL